MTQSEFLESLNTRTNEFYNKDITLKDGEVWCSVCKGKGIPIPYKSGICPKCFGTGKLDWISNVMWKRNVNTTGSGSIFGTSGSSCVFIGPNNGCSNISGSGNIAIGYQAGYGFRDNTGVPEVKSSGGSWYSNSY